MSIHNEGENSYSRLQENGYEKYWNPFNEHNSKLENLKMRFHQKHPRPELCFPGPVLSGVEGFQWQKSFHDHVIRNEKDFETHMKYIEYNPIKHEMPKGWRWWGFG